MPISTAFILEELEDAYNQHPPCNDYSTVNTSCETSIDSFEEILSLKNGGSTIGTYETQTTSETHETMKITNVSRGNVSIPVHELLIEARSDVENKVDIHSRPSINNTETKEKDRLQSTQPAGTFQNMKEMIANAFGCGCVGVALENNNISDNEIIAAVEQQIESYGGQQNLL